MKFRFLLIPALLGVTIQLDDNDVTSRVSTLKTAEVEQANSFSTLNHYYLKAHLQSFLELMQLYDIEKIEIEKSALFQSVVSSTSETASLDALANARKAKISRLKRTNELRQQLKELNKRTIESQSIDEDLAVIKLKFLFSFIANSYIFLLQRELYLTELKYWVNRALDELDSAKSMLTLYFIYA